MIVFRIGKSDLPILNTIIVMSPKLFTIRI